MPSKTTDKALILIVDDHKHNLQVLGQMLEDADYDIAIANNGTSAISTAQNLYPDLILLDIMMPDIDGYTVCQNLKKIPSTQEIPIIFLTAKVETNDIIKGFAQGAVDYINKPFSTAELLARVKTHLDLKKSREALQQLNASKDTFFSIIFHDLKSSLSGIMDLASMIVESLDEPNPNEIQENLHLIARSGKQLYNLLENLLDWSRVQSGAMVWNPETITVGPVVSAIKELFEAKCAQKKLPLKATIDPMLTCFADNDMLLAVLRNLVSNAIKFTPSGGSIEIGGTLDHNNLELWVKDSGIGMKPEQKEHFFDMGKKQSTPGTQNEPGTGLGLFLCQSLIHKSKGTLWVESAQGKGTTFFFTLPLVNPLQHAETLAHF